MAEGETLWRAGEEFSKWYALVLERGNYEIDEKPETPRKWFLLKYDKF